VGRKTNFTLEELIAEFKKPWPALRRCLILNEIGEICNEGGKDAKKAEEFLRSLLGSEDEKDKLYAFSWLSVIENLEPQTLKRLEEFKKDPANKKIIKRTKPQIERYNKLYK
jgi:hypothetical protein